MGFDITFHPISKADLDRYLFEVADNPTLAEARAKELAVDGDDFQMIMEFYYQKFPRWLAEAAEKERRRIPAFAAFFVRTAAALAGFKYPYWYCRGSALSFVAGQEASLRALFTPVGRMTQGVLSTMGDCSDGLIAENFSASGFIADLPALRKELGRLSHSVDRFFDKEGHWALENALAFAEQRGLGLIEAADVYVPMQGGGSKFANLRADFLQNRDHDAS
jgi:hypothetical protein